jgi:enamine deaminase RidA (YjgF/YER057c/UK114 family)
MSNHGAGLTPESICFLRVLVASSDRDDLVAAWQALKALLPDMPPATLQGVTVLGYPDQLVELEIVARSR